MSRRRSGVEIDWSAVERAMRRSAVTGPLPEDQQLLCLRAYRSEPERYSTLSRRIRAEAFEDERRKWSGA